jgi:predicted transglutaminase-like protease
MVLFRLTGGYLLVGGACCFYLQKMVVPYFIVFHVGLKYFPSSAIWKTFVSPVRYVFYLLNEESFEKIKIIDTNIYAGNINS